MILVASVFEWVQRNVEIEWTSDGSTAEDQMMLPCPGTPLEMLGCFALEWTSDALTAEDQMMLPCLGTPLEMLGCLAQDDAPLSWHSVGVVGLPCTR